MKLIRAGLDGGDDNGAARAPILSWSYAGVDLELLNRIDCGEEQHRVHKPVVVVYAIENEVVCLRAKTVNRQCAIAALVIAHGLGVV